LSNFDTERDKIQTIKKLRAIQKKESNICHLVFGIRHFFTRKCEPVTNNEQEYNHIVRLLAEDIANIFVSLYPAISPFKRSSLQKIRRKLPTNMSQDMDVLLAGIIEHALLSLSKNDLVADKSKGHLAIKALSQLVKELTPFANNLTKSYNSLVELQTKEKELRTENSRHLPLLNQAQVELDKLDNAVHKLENWNQNSLAYRSGRIKTLLDKKRSQRDEAERNLDMLSTMNIGSHLKDITSQITIIKDTINTDTRQLKEGVLDLSALLESHLGLMITRRYNFMLKQTANF
jgi:hypothetical protein